MNPLMKTDHELEKECEDQTLHFHIGSFSSATNLQSNRQQCETKTTRCSKNAPHIAGW